MKKLRNCPACKVKPGEPHERGCDVELCSACGNQLISCHCKGEHDPLFSRWTGIWPGRVEAEYFGIDLNQLFDNYSYKNAFFIKPKLKKKKT